MGASAVEVLACLLPVASILLLPVLQRQKRFLSTKDHNRAAAPAPVDATSVPAPFDTTAVPALADSCAPVPVETIFKNEEEYVIARRGGLPLLLTIPHGGTWSPHFLPDQNGVKCTDQNTLPLALLAAEKIGALTDGRRPYLVALGLHRRKLDVNRNKGHRCPNGLAQRVWEQYHTTITVAIEDCCAHFGGCHVIDVHGTVHKYTSGKRKGQKVEYADVGFGLTREQINLEDGALDALTRTSFAPHGGRVSELVRGEHSVGAFLELAGLPGGAVPSNHPERRRVPKNVDGYYGASGDAVSTMRHHNAWDRNLQSYVVTTNQIEFPSKVRMSGVKSEEFDLYTSRLAEGLIGFLVHWFGPEMNRPPVQSGPCPAPGLV